MEYQSEYEQIERAIDWHWFENLWNDPPGDMEDFFDCAAAAQPGLSFSKWCKGWQHRTVLHVDLEAAKEEFVMAIMGV